MTSSRPTWAEISLRALRKNFETIQQIVGGNASVCAVVKANAYGHGAVECARALGSAGAQWFGVTSTDEGLELREAGIAGRILLMTGFWRGDEPELIRARLTPAVWEGWHLEALQQAAKRGPDPVPVHLKVDTGMARLGVSMPELPNSLGRLRSASNLVLEGVFTHLASAETSGAADVSAQIKQFGQAIRLVEQGGFAPKYYHIANSAAIVTCPETWEIKRSQSNNLVRPGISLYGYSLPLGSPGGKEKRSATRAIEVEPVLSWKTRVISLRTVSTGQHVGYNGTYVAGRESRLAVLPVGYADGLNRMLSSRGRVIVRGKYAPIVGRVSMDITLVDVTDVPHTETGDEVLLIGASGDLSITAWEHAQIASTIPYEILCNVSSRVPRLYVD
ncbi:MAG TPA: alanine racemase [Terriglobales bacterium]|nr:alanine racemase [Terriglobales bacterium]